MINLFINFYNDLDLVRQMEINECLSRNIANPMIDRVYLIVENLDLNFFDFDHSEKVEVVIYSERPTYSYFFELANSKITVDDISIISNADIYFDDYSLSLVNHNLQAGTCFALSRWDRESDGTIHLFDRADSQDSWIFKGKIGKIDNCYFTQGTLGCDNAICHRIEAAGYTIKNPSRDIKSIHIHNTGIRHYIPLDHSQMVEQPYKLIRPATLEPMANWVTELANVSARGQQSQYNEDAIIDHIFRHIGVTDSYFVDLGASAYGDATMSNTRSLIHSDWNGYGVDIRNKGESWIIERFITPYNILEIFSEQNTPVDFDFLNLDIDSCDFWVLKEVLRKYSPRCICTEFNGTLDPEISIVLKYEQGYVWDETNKYGFSFTAGKKLLAEHGYQIIHNMLNQNIFAVKKELVKGLVFEVNASRVPYHPHNPHAIWESY